MNLDFPQGDLYYTMSEELQYQFYQKMKDVVWEIEVEIIIKNKCVTYEATGFCIDARGLLLTVAHVIEVDLQKDDEVASKVEVDKGTEVVVNVSARRDKQVKFHRCEIAYELKHFDLLLLKVNDENQSDGFDYVSIDGKISRNIPYGREVFSIGICKTQGLHLLRGRLAYGNKRDETNYLSLAKEENLESTRKIEDINFYNDRTYRVRKGSLASDEMHPELTYLQMQFIGISEFGGMSGAPVFDSKGRVIGMLQSDLFSCKGVTSAAMEAMLNCYYEALHLG